MDSTAPSPSARSPLADLLSRLVGYSLPVVYFLVTVSFYLKTYDSAQVKITFTQIGCTLVMLLWFTQLLVEKRWPFQKKDLPVLAPFLAYLGSGVLSFTQSSFLAGSFDEFLRRVLYCFMGLIVIVEFRGWDRYRRLRRWLLAAFGVCIFYGLVQYFDTRLFPSGPGIGLDPFVWRYAFGRRPFSTFGNPNFFGNFLVIVTPILLAIYLRSGGKISRPYLLTLVMVGVVYFSDRLFVGFFGGVTGASQGWVQAGLLLAAALALGVVWWKSPTAAASGMLLFYGALFINLYSTETKGAWLGFLAALMATTLLVGFFFLGASRQAARRTGLMVLATALIGAAVVGFYAKKRFTSVSFRGFTWIATWDMIRTQPLLGTGIGSFKWAYPAYRRPEIIIIEGKSNTETDHAEDEYLEVWFDEGALGFVIFLWMILTASVMGVRALGLMNRNGARGPPGEAPRYSERAYEILAYMGAYWGALIHWFVDVSVRFVSSGIYSVLLPSLVAGLVRHDHIPARQDPRSSLDRWIRLGTAVAVTAVMLSLNMAVFPVLLCGAGVWLLGEILEFRLTPEDPAPEKPLEEGALEAGVRGLAPWRLALVACLAAAWVYGFTVFRNFFMADVNHNIAIFFSKQGVWTKSPEFDSVVANFPPEMQEEYKNVGGALEHYDVVSRLNPFFPMSRYFVGNVYNDWGSTVHNRSMEARQKGDVPQALALRRLAEEKWMKSLKTYDGVKAFAPNYVQTHHQVGLVYLKLGDTAKAWGDEEKAQEYWDLALKNFELYRHLDPVYAQNYYRMAYIHFLRGDYKKAEQDYLDALKYNTENVIGFVFNNLNSESYSNLGRLYYILLVNKHKGPSPLPTDSEEYKKALSYYQSALKCAENTEINKDRLLQDAVKGLAILYSRADVRDKATEMWLRMRTLAPNDPDVQNVFRAR